MGAGRRRGDGAASDPDRAERIVWSMTDSDTKMQALLKIANV